MQTVYIIPLCPSLSFLYTCIFHQFFVYLHHNQRLITIQILAKMKRKTPITDWQTGTEILNDIEISYVAKSISYDLDGICLFVGRRTDNPTPVEFYYFLELDIDPIQAVTISFLKRGLLQTGFNFTLPPQESNQRPYIVKFPNVITIPPIGYTLNFLKRISTAILLCSTIRHKMVPRKSSAFHWLSSMRNIWNSLHKYKNI